MVQVRRMNIPQIQQVRLNAARAQFFDGVGLPDQLLPASVLASWQRSRDCGLAPSQSPLYDTLQPLRNVREEAPDRRLYQCVHQEMEQLWSAFGGSDWTIFCVNPQGLIIHARQSPGCRDPVLRPITIGRRLQERDVGTTAPGCVLSDGQEAIVDGQQHYLDAFAQTFCLSVPLWGTEGQVIGALDISGHGERDVGLLQEHFRQAALSAEDRVFKTLGHCHLLRVQHDPRWLASPMAGVLAIEDDGRLRAASRLARRILGLSMTGPLRGLNLEQLFAGALPAQQRRLLTPAQTPHRIARADGSHVWVQHERAPLRSVPATLRQGALAQATLQPVLDPPADLRLDEHALSHVIRSLDEHDGNVAATARQLGISRTTLYAKLRQAREAGITPD
jgi:transcriptional regulator of acetoin/glycerol metabolism